MKTRKYPVFEMVLKYNWSLGKRKSDYSEILSLTLGTRWIKIISISEDEVILETLCPAGTDVGFCGCLRNCLWKMIILSSVMMVNIYWHIYKKNYNIYFHSICIQISEVFIFY